MKTLNKKDSLLRMTDCNSNAVSTWQYLLKVDTRGLMSTQFGGSRGKTFGSFQFLLYTNTHKFSFSAKQCAVSHTSLLYFQSSQVPDAGYN